MFGERDRTEFRHVSEHSDQAGLPSDPSRGLEPRGHRLGVRVVGVVHDHHPGGGLEGLHPPCRDLGPPAASAASTSGTSSAVPAARGERVLDHVLSGHRHGHRASFPLACTVNEARPNRSSATRSARTSACPRGRRSEPGPGARGVPANDPVVGGQDRDVTGAQLLDGLRRRSHDGFPRAEDLHVGDPHVRDDRHVRSGDAAQQANVAHVPSSELQDERFGARWGPQHRQGHSHLRVERARTRVGAEATSEHRGGEVLGRRLPVRTSDTDNTCSEFGPLGGGKVQQRVAGIRDPDRRHRRPPAAPARPTPPTAPTARHLARSDDRRDVLRAARRRAHPLARFCCRS